MNDILREGKFAHVEMVMTSCAQTVAQSIWCRTLCFTNVLLVKTITFEAIGIMLQAWFDKLMDFSKKWYSFLLMIWLSFCDWDNNKLIVYIDLFILF